VCGAAAGAAGAAEVAEAAFPFPLLACRTTTYLAHTQSEV